MNIENSNDRMPQNVKSNIRALSKKIFNTTLSWTVFHYNTYIKAEKKDLSKYNLQGKSYFWITILPLNCTSCSS